MQVTIPHKFTPRPYQLPFFKAMDSGIKRAVLVWNRRAGKDKACWNFMIKKAMEKVGTYFYMLPEYKQAKKVVWDNIDNSGFKMLDHIPPEITKNINNSELKIELINGSIIQLIAADTFKQSGVGSNPSGVVFSEYSISSPEAWKYVAPILAVNGGWAVFNMTPRGRNHGWALLQQAKQNPNWFWQVLTVDDTKVLTPEASEEEKLANSIALIEQEYYCAFTENAGAFFRRVRQNTYESDIMLPENGNFQLGVDLAKYADWTVITPFNINSFIVYPQTRFNQVDWVLQKARIETEARRHYDRETGETALVIPDSTGVGDPIVEDLAARGLRIYGEDDRGFKFTETSRRQLLDHLAVLLEQDKIKIPNDEGLITELESFQYSLSENGKVRVGVPSGVTDDRVMSLALAVWGVNERVQPDTYTTVSYTHLTLPTIYSV